MVIDSAPVMPFDVEGPIALRPVSRSGFPTHELIAAGATIALMAFTLIDHGIPGVAKLVPTQQ